jgi:hypothetical protein
MLIVKKPDGKYSLCVEINRIMHLCVLNGRELSFDTFDDCDAFLAFITKKSNSKVIVIEGQEIKYNG